MRPESVNDEAMDAEKKHNQEWREQPVDETHQMVALAAT
jgi:hypothetical protein